MASLSITCAPHPKIKFRRGDPSAEHPGLVFECRRLGTEIWVTPERQVEIKRMELERKRKKYPEKCAKQKARYRGNARFREESKNRAITWRRKHPERGKAAMKKWLAKPGSKEKVKALHKAWLATPEGRAKLRALQRKYRETPNGIIINRVRSRIAVGLKRGYTKSASTLDLIGCSIAAFREHLESQFTDGMTWENSREWEIDHILPISMFDLRSIAQQKLAFNWRNCRPLWTNENRTKNDTVEGELFRGRHYSLRKPNIIPFQEVA